ncbi:MAG: 2-phospho-L-lactate guanylyltransferase [Sorangiineae bacterium]|nr:2-phospho-L-lactate guanylyltransferase [Polyangiaceae bacterium]MEB2323850.1 2-phospho-L-lactate guanylyltransferase [Sorangiineae bacterium]
MTLSAVVPVKGFERAKSRLAPMLGERARAELAGALFERVLAALLAAPGVARVLVVSDSDAVLERAAQAGATTRRDAARGGLGRIVDAALAELDGARALVVMSDLPLITVEDIALVTSSAAPVVIAPDERGEGTNALALPLPPPFATAFGAADSARRHRALAPGAAVVRSPGLAFDLDEPADLAELERRRGAPVAGRAGPPAPVRGR